MAWSVPVPASAIGAVLLALGANLVGPPSGLQALESELSAFVTSGADGTGALDVGAPRMEAASPLLTPPEAQLLSLINASRTDAGVLQLEWDPTATDAARAHAQEMLEWDFFHTTDPHGVGAIERLKESGGQFAYWGENHSLSSSVSRSHAEDMRIQPYRQNILDPRFGRVGIGVATRADQMLLITVVFLTP